LAEPGDRAVIRNVLCADHPESHIHLAQPLDLTRRTDPKAIGIDEQRQQHVRVEGRPACTPIRVAATKGGGIQLLDHADHEPCQMIRRQPVPHVHRQQELLITHHSPKPLRHDLILNDPDQ